MGRNDFVKLATTVGREVARAKVAKAHADEQARRTEERQKREADFAAQAYRKQEAERLLASRLEEVDLKNEALSSVRSSLEGLLGAALWRDSFVEVDPSQETEEPPQFDAQGLDVPLPEPVASSYEVKPPSIFTRWIAGSMSDHARAQAAAKERFAADLEQHGKDEAGRLLRLAALRREHEAQCEAVRARLRARQAEGQALADQLRSGRRVAVERFFGEVLARSPYPTGFPRERRVGFDEASRLLAVDCEMPPPEIVPALRRYRHVKATDEIVGEETSQAERRALYTSILAEMPLRTIHEIFKADRHGVANVVAFSGHVSTRDRATGRAIRPCLVSLRVTRSAFQQIDLNNVDPAACLQHLRASFSSSPGELTPVRPILDFDMFDPRFIPSSEVLGSLDHRPNLMDLTWQEFEALIANLFQRMGLETRQTRPSRDGGVDCVAYDPRPIMGGKVVIQAKRYKNTVGVGAVRDLYGTFMAEGASKGILVTTSGYGQASFDFAKGRPLELLSGPNLLYLLEKHAGVRARIVAPAAWRDPEADSGGG